MSRKKQPESDLTATANENEKLLPLITKLDPYPNRSKLPVLNRNFLLREIARKLSGSFSELVALPHPEEVMLRIVLIGDTKVICAVNDEEKRIKILPISQLLEIVSDYSDKCREVMSFLPYKGIESAFGTDRKWLEAVLNNIEDISSTSQITDWKPIRMAEDRGWCMNRLTFPLEATTWEQLEQKAPFTYEWLNRCDKPEIVARWLYDLVTEGGSAKKQLWIWGEKDSMKSSLFSAIGSFYSDTYAVIDDSNFSDRYQWLGSNLLGKGLVLIDDCDPHVCTNRKWKAVTGSDEMSVERKFKGHSVGKRTCRFVCTSNFPPSIPFSDIAVGARLAVVNIKPGHKPDGAAWKEWKKAIGKEFRHLLGHGMHCPKIPDMNLEDAIENHPYYDLLTLFKFESTANTTAMGVHNILQNNGLRTDRQIAEFKKLLQSAFGVKSVTKRVDGKVTKIYPGLRIL